MNGWKRETGSKESGNGKQKVRSEELRSKIAFLGRSKSLLPNVLPSLRIQAMCYRSLLASTPIDLDVVQDGHRRKHSVLYGSGDLHVIQVGRPLSPSTLWKYTTNVN